MVLHILPAHDGYTRPEIKQAYACHRYYELVVERVTRAEPEVRYQWDHCKDKAEMDLGKRSLGHVGKHQVEGHASQDELV